MENFIDDIYKNIIIYKLNTQLSLINLYRVFIQNNNYSQISPFFKTSRKMALIVEENIQLNDLKEFEMTQILNLLFSFSFFQVGSIDLYTEIDKFIGSNINQVDPNHYVDILHSFVSMNRHRDKLINLFQNKILENKTKINLNHMAKMLRIFSSIKLSNQTIFEKLEPFIIENKNKLVDYELCDVIYSYSDLKIQNNHVLMELEEIVVNNLETWESEGKYNIIIDIILSYLQANKGEKETIDKFKNVVLRSKINPHQVTELSVLNLFKIFTIFNLQYDQVKHFDFLLKSKLKYFLPNELIAIKEFLVNLNYKNEKTNEIIENLLKIGNNEKDKYDYLNKMKLL